MTIGGPPKPAKIRGCNATMTITTVDDGNISSSGMPYESVGSNETLVPCRLDTVSPGEAQKYGHSVNETVYRLRCPVVAPDGSGIVLRHGQYVTITGAMQVAGGTVMQINGDGQPQGRSGQQHAVLKVEAK